MEYPATMSTDTDSTESADEVDGVRSLAKAPEYTEDAPDLPKIEIPCFGCGRRGVLRHPYADDLDCMWCVNCGTLHNKGDDDKITASIPVLCADVLRIFGSSPAIDRIQEHMKKTAEAAAEAADGS